jgi:hypothetical protein
MSSPADRPLFERLALLHLERPFPRVIKPRQGVLTSLDGLAVINLPDCGSDWTGRKAKNLGRYSVMKSLISSVLPMDFDIFSRSMLTNPLCTQ